MEVDASAAYDDLFILQAELTITNEQMQHSNNDVETMLSTSTFEGALCNHYLRSKFRSFLEKSAIAMNHCYFGSEPRTIVEGAPTLRQIKRSLLWVQGEVRHYGAAGLGPEYL